MRRYYLDTNLVLDLLLDRAPFAETAEELFAAAKQGRAELLVSSLTYTTAHYIVSKAIGKVSALQALAVLFGNVSSVAVDEPVIGQALQSGLPDFEDAVQLYAALAAGAEAIVTRDPKGFPTRLIPVVDPLAALAQL